MTTIDDMSGGDVLAAGTRLEEFEIERELGAGGFGVTYLAHDRSLDRQVAIKEYLPHDWGARGPDGLVGPRSATHAQDYRWGLERFLDEARVLARLHHPHIVQVHRVIEAWGTAYMVTEYVEGRSLAEALRAEGPWAEARVVSLLDALTAGLAAVHGAGLVHRDVKPANVMLRGGGSPVLIDFGAARQAVGGRSRSVTAVLTPGYAPIEQYSEKGRQGPWTDVYALGAVAYEALSGRAPDEATERALDDGLQPVAAAASQAVSAGLSSAVMSALALRREDRPQRLEDWRASLGLPVVAGAAGDAGARATVSAGLSEPSGAAARSVSGPVGVSRASRRRWLAVAAVLAVVALSVAGLVWWVGGARAPESAGTVARAPVGEDAVGAALGEGGGRGGSEASDVGVSGPVDAAAAAEAGARDGSDSPMAANEAGSAPESATPDDSTPVVSGPEDSAPNVAPEAAEEALGLDRAGWRRIQEGLVALGLDPGTPDGLVGGGTRRAVRMYQEGAGKAATGFLDAADVATLQRAALEAAETEQQRLAEAEAERQRLAAEAEAAAEAERQRLAAEAEAAAEAERQRLAAEAAEAERLAELRRPGRVFRDCDGCPEMVVIPAGEFQMGSPASEEGRYDGEGPQHGVTVGSFALGRREVTRSEYAAFVTATGRGSGDGCRVYDREWSTNAQMSWREPGFSQGGGHPVVCVNWRDAQAYAAWLSEETGESYRLPSESEWEYAARAGTTTARYWGRGADDQCEYGNGADEAGRRHFDWNRSGVAGCDDGVIWTASAGSYGANDFRLFDMLGNVLEWVEDCWHENYAGAPRGGTAWTSSGDCSRRVLRGGSWDLTPRLLRSAARDRIATELRATFAGFRVARTLD